MSIRAFRFRPATDPQFTIDILKNNRLFCADWRDLNDPMEGTYDTLVSEPHKHHAAVRAIYEAKIQKRVCSLARTYKSHSMWAYYASDYRGAVIEIAFPPALLADMDYASGSRIQKWAHDANPYEIATKILTTKHSDWAGERELRLLSHSTFHELPEGSIKRVILGSRISAAFERDIEDAAGDIPLHRLRSRGGELKAEQDARRPR